MRHVRITNTRPDLVKSVCYLACFVENPGISHKTALERVLRYLSSSTDKGIKYQSPTNGGGGTRTTALLLQTLTSVAIQPRTRAHLDTFAFWNANMRTMSSTGFRATNSRFSFNHRSGTLRCWTWRYRRHLGKIAVNRTENDSAMQAHHSYHNTNPILNQPKHLLKGAATRVDYAMWQYNFVRDLNEVGLVEFEWIRSKINLLTCWVSQVLHSTQ